MSPMKRYQMICERRLTSTDICIHPRGRAGYSSENSELDITTTGTSSESFQYRLKRRHEKMEKYTPESTSSTIVEPSISDDIVDTVEYTGGLINLMINGETEMDGESESSSTEEPVERLSPGDAAMNQMRLILSPRADDVILDVLDSCRYCCMGICNGDLDLQTQTRRKPFSKYKRQEEFRNSMQVEFSRKRRGKQSKKKGGVTVEDEASSMEDNNLRAMLQSKQELEKTLEEETRTLMAEKIKLEEEKKKILEERMKLNEKRKRLLDEGISSQGSADTGNIPQPLSNSTFDNQSTEMEKVNVATDKTMEGKLINTAPTSQASTDIAQGSSEYYSLGEIKSGNSFQRGSKELGSITQALSNHSTQNEQHICEGGKPELVNSKETVGSAVSERRSVDMGRISQVSSSHSSQKEKHICKGSKPEVVKSKETVASVASERKSLDVGSIAQVPSSHSSRKECHACMGGKLESANSKETIGSVASERKSMDVGSIPQVPSSHSSRKECHACMGGKLESVNSKETVGSIASERKSMDVGSIPQVPSSHSSRKECHACMGGKLELVNSKETVGSIASERKSMDLGSIPEVPSSHSSCKECQTCAGRRSEITSSDALDKRPDLGESIPQVASIHDSQVCQACLGRKPEITTSVTSGRRSNVMESIPHVESNHDSKKVCQACVGRKPEIGSSSASDKISNITGSIPKVISSHASWMECHTCKEIKRESVISGAAEKNANAIGSVSHSDNNESPQKKCHTCLRSKPESIDNSISKTSSKESENISHVASSDFLQKVCNFCKGSGAKFLNGSASESRSVEMNGIPPIASSNGLEVKSAEYVRTPEMLASSFSERGSTELGVIPERDSSVSRESLEKVENIPTTKRSNGSDRMSGEIRNTPDKLSRSSIGKLSSEKGSIQEILRRNAITIDSEELGNILERLSGSSLGTRSIPQAADVSLERKFSANTSQAAAGIEERSSERFISPEMKSYPSSGRRSVEMGSITHTENNNGSQKMHHTCVGSKQEFSGSSIGKLSTEMRSIPQIKISNGLNSASNDERIIQQISGSIGSERKSIDIVDIQVKDKIPSAEIGRLRELIANYALVRRPLECHSAPQILNFKSEIQDITPEEFETSYDEKMKRLKLNSLDLQVLRQGEYKEYREEELSKLEKALDQRELEWQANENRRREDEEQLRALERMIKEKLSAVSEQETADNIENKMEEELEQRIKKIDEREEREKSSTGSDVCFCSKRKNKEEMAKELLRQNYEKKIGSPSLSKGSFQSQEQDRQVTNRSSLDTCKEEDTKIGSERASVVISKEYLERESVGSSSAVKSQDRSKSSLKSETKQIKSSHRSFDLSEDVVPQRVDRAEFRKSESVGSTKSGQLEKAHSFVKDEKLTGDTHSSQLSMTSSEKMRMKIRSFEEIIAFTMEEDKSENRTSETILTTSMTEKGSNGHEAEEKGRVKATCCECDESGGYKIDIENVIARERSFTKYKIKEKSSESPKISLGSYIPSSGSRSNDKIDIKGSQTSNTYRKSLELGVSATSSRSKQDNKGDINGVDCQKSSDTVKRSFESSISTIRSHTCRVSGSDTKKVVEQARRISLVDVGIATDPIDLPDEIRTEIPRTSFVDTGVGSHLEVALVSTAVGTDSRDSVADLDNLTRNMPASESGLENENIFADNLEQGSEAVPSTVDAGIMTEPIALLCDVKELNEAHMADIGVGTDSGIFSSDKEVKTNPFEDVTKSVEQSIIPESKESLPKESLSSLRDTDGKANPTEVQKEKSLEFKSISTPVSRNRDMTPKVEFTQVDTKETIISKNMSVGRISSRIDVTHTAVRFKNVSVGRSVADLGKTTVNINSVSVACGSSVTDADSFVDTTEEDDFERKRRRKLRFVAVTEDELSSREFKTMKVRALRHFDRTEELDRSSKRLRRFDRKLDSSAGADLTHYLQMKKALKGTMEIPQQAHNKKNLRFHIHNSKGDIVGYGELGNHSTSSHDNYLRLNSERVMMIKGSELDRSRERHAASYKGETCSRSLTSGTHSHIHHHSAHRKKTKEKVGTVWAVARIDEFDQGERTMEIVSTDVKKPTELITHRGGKYDKEVYVLVPPNKHAHRK